MNTLIDCNHCKIPLTIGVHIDMDSKGKCFPSKSINEDSKACLKCNTDFCHFCNNIIYDFCMCCDKAYCEKCAEKWEKETGLDFMWDDHNNCMMCYKSKNKL
jgi:hypothetical protein